MMRTLRKVPVLAALLAVPAVAWSQPSAEIRQLEQSIRRDVQEVVGKIDASALITVRVVPLSREVRLPLTPLKLENLIIRNEGGGPAIERIQITIFTSLERMPDSVVEFVKRLSALEGIRTEVSVEPIPPSVVSVLAEEKSLGQHLESMVGKVTTTMVRFRFYELVGSLVVGGSILLFLFFFIRRRVPEGAPAGSLGGDGSVLNRIADSLEQLTLMASRSRGERQVEPADRALGQGPALALAPGPEGGNVERVIADLEKSGVLGLLSDCYWGEYDGYAAYIWNRVPVGMRREIVSEYPPLARYTSYLSDVTEINLNRHNEPYYLNPLPIYHLDNRELTDLVRRYPRLLFVLSSLRVEKLELTAREKIELNSKMSEELPQMGRDGNQVTRFNQQRFKERNFVRKAAIRVDSIEEEEAILTLEDLTLDLKSQIPSLGWLLELSRKEVGDLLEKYTAQELAAVWIGPERVLDRLGSYLPEKKYQLVKEYREKVTPSREHPVMKEIHAVAIELLRAREDGHDKTSGSSVPNVA